MKSKKREWEKILEENVNYDPAELGCNWGMDELKAFIQQEKDKSYKEGVRDENEKINMAIRRLSGQWEGQTIEWIEGNKKAFRDILALFTL